MTTVPHDADPELGVAQPKIFLLTHPRTASNMVMKLFAKHPQLCSITYPFQGVYFVGAEKLLRRKIGKSLEWRDDAESATYQSAFDELQRSISIAEEQGKVPLIKEHAEYFMDPKIVDENFPSDVFRFDKPVVIDRVASASVFTFEGTVDSVEAAMCSSATSSNPTVLPDSFMDSVRPVILVRHPARMFLSCYRVLYKNGVNINLNDEQNPVDMTLRWLKLIHDWYAGRIPERARSLGSKKQSHENSSAGMQFPLVLDAEDIINDEGVIRSLCAALELDPLHVQYSWDKCPVEERSNSPTGRKFWETLSGSTGIIRSDKDTEIDVAKEKQSWTEEFGSEVADALAKHVELAMPDYEYLRSFRLRSC